MNQILCESVYSSFPALCGNAVDGTMRDNPLLLVLSACQHFDHKQCFF